MNTAMLIRGFIKRAEHDSRIGPSHIGLYLAIVLAYEQQGYRLPVTVFRWLLMPQAKIRTATTYYKCLRDLQTAGFIRYVSSYDWKAGTEVYLLNDEVVQKAGKGGCFDGVKK